LKKNIGRYENLQQAKDIDEELLEVLGETNTWYAAFKSHDNEMILDYVLANI